MLFFISEAGKVLQEKEQSNYVKPEFPLSLA
jgi:hypothetical protein